MNITQLPDFITFTGLDARTDLRRAAELSARYPIEWGVLFSRSRQGIEPRYPDEETLMRIICDGPRRIAAHLCGAYSREIMGGEHYGMNPPVDLGCFQRIQVNHEAPDVTEIARFCRSRRACGIAQCRGEEFPANSSVDWLFDRSGGEGKIPGYWPHHPGSDRLVGYAGGINPDNVLDVLGQVASDGPYWIDMESGVRTEDLLDLQEWLDLRKVEAVCRAVYGTR